jgi:hypothetical protein
MKKTEHRGDREEGRNKKLQVDKWKIEKEKREEKNFHVKEKENVGYGKK